MPQPLSDTEWESELSVFTFLFSLYSFLHFEESQACAST